LPPRSVAPEALRRQHRVEHGEVQVAHLPQMLGDRAVLQALGEVVEPHLAVGLWRTHCIGEDVADVGDFLSAAEPEG